MIVGRERKAILKQAAEAWLPREIVYRPKGLFSARLRAWIRRDLADMVEDLVAGGPWSPPGWWTRRWCGP